MIEIFGLLYLDVREESAVNISKTTFRDLISIYINNAKILSSSLQAQAISFTLLTNHKAWVDEYVASGSQPLQVKEIPFATQVPAGIRFYSAHYKLDAFRYLASLCNGYVALCDLDMVCINDFPGCLKNIVQAGIPLCYDISDQVIPAYGHDVIMQDLTALHGLESEGRWSGGEYISGKPEFFKALVKEIGCIYTNYTANHENLHHIGGEEVITSAALEILRRQGRYIADAGTLGIVGRYWNSYTLHTQKSFDYFKQCFLLHLPGDKRFLSDLAQRGAFVSPVFKKLYARHRNSVPIVARKLAHRSVRLLQNILLDRKPHRPKRRW
jgi:hypothetical protein